MDLIILKHVVKGFAELIRHLLNFELFTVNLILNVVNPIMRRKKSINLVVPYLACSPVEFKTEPNADKTNFTT